MSVWYLVIYLRFFFVDGRDDWLLHDGGKTMIQLLINIRAGQLSTAWWFEAKLIKIIISIEFLYLLTIIYYMETAKFQRNFSNVNFLYFSNEWNCFLTLVSYKKIFDFIVYFWPFWLLIIYTFIFFLLSINIVDKWSRVWWDKRQLIKIIIWIEFYLDEFFYLLMIIYSMKIWEIIVQGHYSNVDF